VNIKIRPVVDEALKLVISNKTEYGEDKDFVKIIGD